MTNFKFFTKDVETLARKIAQKEAVDNWIFFTIDEVEERIEQWIEYLNSEVNDDTIKIKIIKSIFKGYYEYSDPSKEYTEAIIDSVFDVINTNINEGE